MRGWGLFLSILLVTACTGATDGEVVAPETTERPSDGVSEPSGDTEAPGEMSCWTSSPPSGSGMSFSDQTAAVGLVDSLVGMHGHAAIWADIDDDGFLDLYVGTFADREPEVYQVRGATGPAPDRFLIRESEGFAVDGDLPDMFSRTSGGASGDFDNDGDLDLIVSRNWDEDTASAPPSQVLRNDDGILTPVDGSGIPSDLGGRSVAVLDFNQDGMLDVFIAVDRWSGGNSVLLENQGGLAFRDVTREAGLPVDAFGLGVAAADFNGDGFQDLFVSGSNRMFVSDGSGAFREVDSTVFAWEMYGEEDDVAGVSVADVNRDGLLDLLVGHHYNSTVDFGELVPVRLYLNRGSDAAGTPTFEDVTDAAGLTGLPTKAPHVEINDLDNDGWPDLITSASASNGTVPAVFRHQGLDGDIPLFQTPEGLGSPQYWVAGPTADVDRDGRLDLMMVEWEPALPSLFFHNDSVSGHWLEVSIDPAMGFGVGWRVEVYRSGSLGDPDSLLGLREITVTQGYASGVAPFAHFGLGDETEVDLRLVPPGSNGPIDIPSQDVDRHVRYPHGCS